MVIQLVYVLKTRKYEKYLKNEHNPEHNLEMSRLNNNNNLNILDLPDEILFIILKKLNKIDVLYSFAFVNHRFYRSVLDPLYVSDLDMIDITNINSSYDQICSTDIQGLSRFSKQIVPRIHHQVRSLTIEQDSLK